MCLMIIVGCLYDFFFFKQKTAYEMRISDWSSDVCSSDLHVGAQREGVQEHITAGRVNQTAKQRGFAVGKTARHSRDRRDRDDFEREDEQPDRLDMIDLVAGQRGHPEKQRDKSHKQQRRRTPQHMPVEMADKEKVIPLH